MLSEIKPDNSQGSCVVILAAPGPLSVPHVILHLVPTAASASEMPSSTSPWVALPITCQGVARAGSQSLFARGKLVPCDCSPKANLRPSSGTCPTWKACTRVSVPFSRDDHLKALASITFRSAVHDGPEIRREPCSRPRFDGSWGPRRCPGWQGRVTS